MRIGKGKLVGFAIALALAALLLMLLRPHAIRVELEPVRTAPLRVTFVEEGRTRLRDRYLVVAPVAGLVRRIELEQGDPVAAGQVVAELEASPATLLDPANRERIAAEVSAAGSAQRAAAERVRALRLTAQLAQRELERLEAMGTRSAVSVAQLDAARESAQRARAELAAAESEARGAAQRAVAAQALIAHEGERSTQVALPLVAPIAGTVIRRMQESATPVPAGHALLEIGDLAALEVEVEALSTDAVRLAPGSAARVIRWGGEPLPAHVVRVEPGGYTKISALGVEEQRVKVIVAIDAPREAWRALGDGYRVEVEFVLAENAAALQVPSSAVFRHQGRWAVYVADGSHARLRTVGIGQRAGLATEIVEGLREGERVVAFPDDQIADGARIDVARGASP